MKGLWLVKLLGWLLPIKKRDDDFHHFPVLPPSFNENDIVILKPCETQYVSVFEPIVKENTTVHNFFEPIRICDVELFEPLNARDLVFFAPINIKDVEVLSTFEPLSWVRIYGKCYLDQIESKKIFAGSSSSTHVYPYDRLPAQRDIFDIILPLLQPTFDIDMGIQRLLPAHKKLYGYQKEGVKFLAEHQSALLADEQGTGKTIQGILALRILFMQKKILKALIVCPKAVTRSWEKHFCEWAPDLSAIRIEGNYDERYFRWRTPAHAYIVTYETLRNDIRSLDTNSFDVIILDEVQKIKNPDTATHAAVKLINAQYRWGFSGTPMENSLDDIKAIFSYLKPGLLSYSREYQPAQIKKIIKPYVLRRKKEDVLPELPPKVYKEVWLTLTDEQRKEYDALEKDKVSRYRQMGESLTRMHIFALINELKQVCNMASDGSSCKVDYLRERLAELTSYGDKALVFSQFAEKTLPRLKDKLRQYNPLIYTGSLGSRQREEIVENFQNKNYSWVLLMSVKAGGTGITLTRANHVFHFDQWWTPSSASQAEDRAHRIGQNKTVFVTAMFTENTIEERIYNILERKKKLINQVIDSLSQKDMLRSLTLDELFGLFDLPVPERLRKQDKKVIAG